MVDRRGVVEVLFFLFSVHFPFLAGPPFLESVLTFTSLLERG
jgi:hypothetical protein